MGPDLSGGGDGGPRELCEALRYGVRRDSVGFLIDEEGGAKEQGVLFLLGLEILH